MKVKYATSIVEDMDESIKFYTDALGFKIDSQYNPGPGLMITLMKGEGDAMVELIKNTTDEPGFYSVGMIVRDLNATLKELKLKDINILTEPIRTLVGTMAFIEDPNRVRICLIQYH